MVYRILLIGRTGEGKSTITNFLLNRKAAETSFGLDSCTQDPKIHKGKWRGVGADIEIIDTPGMMDGAIGNFGVIKKLKDAALAMKDGIHAVLFVSGLNHMRLDDSVKTMLQLLNRLFPEDEFWAKSAIVYSHWNTLAPEVREESLRKWSGELPQRLASLGSRLNTNNMHCFKSDLDPQCLDNLFPWIQHQTPIVPELSENVAQGNEEGLQMIVAELREQILTIQHQAEKERNELMDQMTSDRQQALAAQLRMQREFREALEKKDRENAERMDRQIRELQRKVDEANARADAAASSGGGGGGSCFLPTAKIVVEGRGPVAASTVKIGDKVLAWDQQNNRQVFSEVYFCASGYAKRKMINLFIQLLEADGGQTREGTKLSITGDHLLLVQRGGQDTFVEASKVQQTDTLKSVHTNTGKIQHAHVFHMENITEPQPQCFILTRHHTLFVDGQLLSCFEKDHQWYIGVTSIVRGLHNVLPSPVMKSKWLQSGIINVDLWLNGVAGAVNGPVGKSSQLHSRFSTGISGFLSGRTGMSL